MYKIKFGFKGNKDFHVAESDAKTAAAAKKEVRSHFPNSEVIFISCTKVKAPKPKKSVILISVAKDGTVVGSMDVSEMDLDKAIARSLVINEMLQLVEKAKL